MLVMKNSHECNHLISEINGVQGVATNDGLLPQIQESSY